MDWLPDWHLPVSHAVQMLRRQNAYCIGAVSAWSVVNQWWSSFPIQVIICETKLWSLLVMNRKRNQYKQVYQRRYKSHCSPKPKLH